MEHHKPVLKVSYINKLTGEIKDEPKLLSEWDLTEGNYSCDCNRAIVFENILNVDSLCKCDKYLVYSVKSNDLNYQDSTKLNNILKEANSGYM